MTSWCDMVHISKNLIPKTLGFSHSERKDNLRFQFDEHKSGMFHLTNPFSTAEIQCK